MRFLLASREVARHLGRVTASPATKLHVLDDSAREQLRQLVEDHGLSGVAKLLDVSRGVVSSAAAGIAIRKGSIEQVRAALAAKRSVNGVSK